MMTSSNDEVQPDPGIVVTVPLAPTAAQADAIEAAIGAFRAAVAEAATDLTCDREALCARHGLSPEEAVAAFNVADNGGEAPRRWPVLDDPAAPSLQGFKAAEGPWTAAVKLLGEERHAIEVRPDAATLELLRAERLVRFASVGSGAAGYTLALHLTGVLATPEDRARAEAAERFTRYVDYAAEHDGPEPELDEDEDECDEPELV